MLFRKYLIHILFLVCPVFFAAGQGVERAEPLSWWTGMTTPLQILFQGQDISDAVVSVREPGVKIKEVHKADSPNYLFVDVEVDPAAEPGIYSFVFAVGGRTFDYEYLIEGRREGSAGRNSFGPADMVYLLMPDRFANGDTSNDSTGDTVEKAERGDLHGRHGGDIQGIIDHLDYMVDLGVTALWSTPLTLDNEPVYSYHGYACADYYRIDPRFGTNELYREMVRQAHAKGIKVIMDAVTNHCGKAHWWMEDLPFADWINRPDGTFFNNHAMASTSDPYASPKERKDYYEGWFDVAMPDINIENPFMRRYLTQLFVWWVEWADLDGLRVDTYPYNEKYAMAEWVASILEEYPNLNIVGEYWNPSPAMIAYWEGGANNRDGFDSRLPSVMDFSWQEMVGAALAEDSIGWGGGLNKVYYSIAHDFLYREPRNLMIFLDNHDTYRFADVMEGNADKVKLGLTLLATTRGVPQLYAGTELMFRSADLTQGHGGARIDFPGGWPGDRLDLFSDGGRTGVQADVFDHARKLFRWRKNEPVVHHGRTMHYLPKNNTYSFFRYDDDEAVFVFINASREPQTIDWDYYSEITSLYSPDAIDVLGGGPVKIAGETEVDGLSGLVLKMVK